MNLPLSYASDLVRAASIPFITLRVPCRKGTHSPALEGKRESVGCELQAADALCPGGGCYWEELGSKQVHFSNHFLLSPCCRDDSRAA